MEGNMRSGGVIKKKSSSGCLIIKKKVESTNSGVVRGFGRSSSSKEKKRPRLPVGSSSSSDEDESLQYMRRKVNDKKFRNGSTRYTKNELEGREYGNNERKRSRLDLFEFDEYDEFDGENVRNEFFDDRFKRVEHSASGNLKKFGVGSSSRNVVSDKRQVSPYFDGSNRRGVEFEEDEGQMPISMLRLKHQQKGDEPIRLQGKNGVLKVMVSKNKKMDLPSQHRNYEPGHKDAVKKEKLTTLPFYPTGNPLQKRGLIVDEERIVKKEKREAKFEKVKSLPTRGKKPRDSEIDETDTVLKLAPPGLQAYSSKKVGKKEEERYQDVTPVKRGVGKEEKPKRGGSTEKQLLREKIRGMLLDAGWTIDYRPRRNRDYLDSVYINSSGTAYWSIIKAYEALKKQENSGKGKSIVASPSFAPLSDDVLNKLTRQTKRKIEEERRRKGNGENWSKCANKSASESEDDDPSDDSYEKKHKIIHGRTSKIIGRCTLLVRGSDKGKSLDSDGYVPYRGKRTVLNWLIDSGSAQLSEKVQYMNKRKSRVMLEGWITRDGVHCGCCSKILTVSKFELHAGSKLRQPFQNIFLESGASLLQCQIDAWSRQNDSLRRDFYTVDVDGDDPDDDTCGICGDGGDLICCDSCPSTFHQVCLGIQMLPSGDWHCPNCKCKFCDAGAKGDAAENDGADDELIRCSLCEKKYHKSCRESVDDPPLISSICGKKCQELYDYLQKILGVKNELDSGYSWSLIQRADVSDPSHRNFAQRVECNSKLAVALSVMNECFLPIFDRKSGINIIQNVVYNCGSNFNRLNYRGFYTAILERGDEVIASASIRIHGTRLAEMPFIGTREIYRRQGMCRRLLSAIETVLTSLGVEKLIIPAIPEHMTTWTTIFRFRLLENELKKEIKSMNMVVFPGTDMLQKQLVKQENSDGIKVSESEKNQLQLPVQIKKSDVYSSPVHNKLASGDSETLHETEESLTAPEDTEVSKVQGSLGSTSRDSDDSTPQIIAKEDGIKSMPSVLETTAQGTVEKVNGEQDPTTFTAKPDQKEPNSDEKGSLTGVTVDSRTGENVEVSDEPSALETTAQSTAEKVNAEPDPTTFTAKRDPNEPNLDEKGSLTGVTVDSRTEENVEGNDEQTAFVSSQDGVEMNEDQKHVPVLTVSGNGEKKVEVDRTDELEVKNDVDENDNLNGENAFDGKDMCPKFSDEGLARNTGENKTGSSEFSDGDSPKLPPV